MTPLEGVKAAKYVGYLEPLEGQEKRPTPKGGRAKTEAGFVRFDPAACSLEEIMGRMASAKMGMSCKFAKGVETRVGLGGGCLVARPLFRELGADAAGTIEFVLEGVLEGERGTIRLSLKAPAEAELSGAETTVAPGGPSRISVRLKEKPPPRAEKRPRRGAPLGYLRLEIGGMRLDGGHFSFPVLIPVAEKTLPELEGEFQGWGEKTQSGSGFGPPGDCWPPQETPAVPSPALDLR